MLKQILTNTKQALGSCYTAAQHYPLLLLFLLTLMPASKAQSSPSEVAASHAEPEIVKTYSAGWTPALLRYHRLALEQALDYSVAEYGPYRIEAYESLLMGARQTLALEEGELFQVNFITLPSFDNNDPKAKGVDINIPMHNGLLGLRKLIVRKSDYQRFNNSYSAEVFAKLRAGQVYQWPDVQVYHDSGIQVVKGVSTENLLNMLQQGRFDYLPLSVLEIETFLEKHKEQAKTLKILDNISVFYPIQAHASVTKSNKTLVARLQKGFAKAIENGDLNRIFHQEFKALVATLFAQDNHIFVLENTLLSAEENCQLIPEFIGKYFPKNKNIIYFEPKSLEKKDVRTNETKPNLAINNDLLGLRKMVIRKKDVARFTNIQSIDDFKSLRVGQRRQSSESKIYRASGIEVVSGRNIHQLLEMLRDRHFDYLPLSILDIEKFSADYENFSAELSIMDDLNIYYPISSHTNNAHVNIAQKKSAPSARLQDKGQASIDDNNDLNRLFQRSFKSVLDALNNKNSRVFILRNPDLSATHNCQLIPQFINEYFSKKSNIMHIR
ncbi:MAG: hypothetical protein COA42_18095 [Alteromonadaceae bacterium]|nr:MAG: hypothetical protein COA42_18095 [Alteromonadaceae bacterium]